MAADPFIGEISLFAGNYAPRNWAFCWGQQLAISSNTALFSILGTTYGGNGVSTFALPDLRGRVPLGTGQLLGGSFYTQGQLGGQESVTLNISNMPMHNHTTTVPVSSTAGNSGTPNGRYLATSDRRDNQYTNQAPDGSLAGVMTGLAGSNAAHENMQPYLSLNFIIALVGTFPSRN
ncbi:phage tail protein [Paracidovorax konjaci]|uniref:Microcystin-dependent protein n=1 Tax=Paracidovorax konjaci TaxID=32040 RepID=A0A1I1XA26_9BURK|nr:tail fiber protein [Paracidovorax konjaci]SFE04245.1 Microcystin-dependent protein [Paracidovorax konjaci]